MKIYCPVYNQECRAEGTIRGFDLDFAKCGWYDVHAEQCSMLTLGDINASLGEIGGDMTAIRDTLERIAIAAEKLAGHRASPGPNNFDYLMPRYPAGIPGFMAENPEVKAAWEELRRETEEKECQKKNETKTA